MKMFEAQHTPFMLLEAFPMRITITSVLVDDQAKAHKFYTEVLGFVTKHDIPLGDARWLTVVSPEDPDGVELLLEPDDNPEIDGAAKRWKQTLVDAEIPYTLFTVKDVHG